MCTRILHFVSLIWFHPQKMGETISVKFFKNSLIIFCMSSWRSVSSKKGKMNQIPRLHHGWMQCGDGLIQSGRWYIMASSKYSQGIVDASWILQLLQMITVLLENSVPYPPISFHSYGKSQDFQWTEEDFQMLKGRFLSVPINTQTIFFSLLSKLMHLKLD